MTTKIRKSAGAPDPAANPRPLHQRLTEAPSKRLGITPPPTAAGRAAMNAQLERRPTRVQNTVSRVTKQAPMLAKVLYPSGMSKAQKTEINRSGTASQVATTRMYGRSHTPSGPQIDRRA